MLADAINKLVSSMNLELILLLIQASIVIFIIMLIRRVVGSLISYIFFRMNERIAIGAEVELDGDIYVIRKIGFFKIELENHNGYLQVPMSRWVYSNFKILKNKSDRGETK